MSNSRRDIRVLLLGGQTFLLGLLAAFIVIPSSGLFIDAYGSEQLPWIYLGTAITGMIGTALLASALRKRSIAAVALPFFGFLSLLSALAWLEDETIGSPWVSAPMFAVFPLSFQIGFVLIGGQAGRVFDLRELKVNFPRIVAGFPLGLIAAGLLTSALLEPIGRISRLMLITTLASVLLIVLIFATKRRYHGELGELSADDLSLTDNNVDNNVDSSLNAMRPSLRKLLAHRFVLVLLGYQLLSQIGTQLVDFLVYDRADARYVGADRVSSFVGNFTTLLNVVNLLFLLLAAGFLLRAYGMKVGLLINPAVVTLFLIAALVVGATGGTSSLMLLVLVGAARISDVALTNGATRTALNAAYQALPSRDRLALQALIEGIGIPVAIGVTGLMLLLLQKVFSIGSYGIMVFTVFGRCSALWCFVSTGPHYETRCGAEHFNQQHCNFRTQRSLPYCKIFSTTVMNPL
jgi:ATP/ADP translocase